MEESELIRSAQHGDSAAFEALIARYTPKIYAFLSHYLADADAAEDATQETFVKAWKALKRFDAEKRFSPWLFAIARNAANDAARRKRALPFSLFARRGADAAEEQAFENLLPDDAPLPDEVFERKALGETVQAALAELPERDRAVLLLRYEENLSFEDIGEVMRAPMNTVKSWHRRALGTLRTILLRRAPERSDEAY